MFSWGFRGTVTQYCSETTINLPLREESLENDSTKVIPFKQLVNLTKSFRDKARFYLNPFFFNGALQTFYLSTHDFQNSYKVYYGRKILTSLDGKSTASLDYAVDDPKLSDKEFSELEKKTHPDNWPRLHPRTRFFNEEELREKETPSDDTRPMLIILHGLAGGSHEPIIRQFVEKLFYFKSVFQEIIVLHSRGCGRSKISTPELFCALSTEDLRQLILLTKKQFPNRPIFVMGFSFGSVILVNYLGQYPGDESKVACAVTIGNPWDMTDSSYHLGSSLSGRYLFSPAVTSFLFKLVKNNSNELKGTSLYQNFIDNKVPKSIVEFDTLYTAPAFGFQSAYDYYRKCSSVNRLPKIKTPLLSINSTDDPVTGINLPWNEFKSNPYCCLLSTDLGGHLSWLQPNNKSWFVDPVSDFFSNYCEMVDSGKPISDGGYEPRDCVFDGVYPYY